ncbi:hypothetical protein MMC22_002215 [Lobaria immixta]|nr:hypothetical protein [Lobaria immixta]
MPTLAPTPMPALAETGKPDTVEAGIEESIAVLELIGVFIELRDPDVVELEAWDEDTEPNDPAVIKLEEDRVAVAASSEKRFVTFLQQILGSLPSLQHPRPEGSHKDIAVPVLASTRDVDNLKIAQLPRAYIWGSVVLVQTLFEEHFQSYFPQQKMKLKSDETCRQG